MDEYTDSDASQSDSDEPELIFDEDVSDEEEDIENPADDNDTRSHFKAWLLRKGLLPHMASDDFIRPSHLHDAVVDTYLRERATVWINDAHAAACEATTNPQDDSPLDGTIPALLTYHVVNGWLGAIIDFARSLRLTGLDLEYPICKAFVNEYPRAADEEPDERPFDADLELDPDFIEDQVLDASSGNRHVNGNGTVHESTGRCHSNGEEEEDEDADDRELRSEHDRRVHGRMMHRLYRHAQDVRHTWLYSIAFKISSKAQNLRGLRWGDLCFKSYDIGTASRQQNLDCLGVLYNQGELNTDGKQEYAGCFRDQNVLICSWAALSLVFFQRFVMESPDGVDLTDKSWLDELLVPSNTQDDVVDYHNAITCEEHGRIIRENAKGIGDTIPSDYENIDYMYRDAVVPTAGDWEKDVLREHYVALPTDAMSNCAGWPEGHLYEIFLPRYDRSKVDMPVTLRIKFHDMFSFADTYIALQECEARVDVKTLSFARLCQRMRETLPEDAPALWKAYPNLSIWKHEPFSSSDWREWVGTQARNCRRSHDRYLRDTLHIRPEMDEMRALQRSTEHLFVRALDRMEGNYTQRLTDTLRETTTAFRGEISELRAALRRLGQSSSPARRDGDPPSSHIHAYNTHAHGYENNHNHSHNQGQGMPIQGNQHQGSGAWMFAHGGESSNNGRHITNDIGMDVFAGAGGAARLSTDNPLNFNSTENTNNLDMYTNIGADPLDFGTDSHTNTTTAHTNTADTDEFGLNLNTNIRVHRRATVDAGTQTNDTDAQSNAGETGEGIDNDAQTHTDTHTQTPDIHTQTPDIHTQTPDTHAQSPDAEAEDMPQAIEYIPPELPSSPEFNAELMSTPLPAPSSLMLLPPIDPRYMTTLSEPVPYGSVESASGISLDSATKDPDGDEHGDAYSDGVGEDASISMDVEATEPYEGEPSATEMVDSRPKTSQERHTRRSKRQEGARANGDAAINGHAPVNGDAAINGHAPAKGTNGCGGGLALEMPGAVEGVSARKFGTTTLRIVHSGKRRLREHSHRGVAPTANTCKKRRTDKVRDHGDRNGVELESELEGDAGPPTPVVAGTKTHKKKQRNDNLLVKNHKSNFRAILRYTPTMEAQLAHRLDEMTEKNVKRYSRYKATFEFVKIVAHVHHAYVHQISVEDAEIKAAADEDERGAMERALVKHMNSMEGKEIDGVRQTALLIMDRVLGCATVEDAESRYLSVMAELLP